jgi:AmpD protein
MSVDPQGWHGGAARIESPNSDARPIGTVIDLLVLHSISLPPGQYGGPAVPNLFTNRLDWDADPHFRDLRGLRVSAHFLVRRDGGLVQFVSCNERAWHAGVSHFEGRAACNDFSIGVELEGLDSTPFMPIQYAVLIRLTEALIARYPLVAVAAHSEIAPGRKTDPGPGFVWSEFLGASRLPLRRIHGA